MEQRQADVEQEPDLKKCYMADMVDDVARLPSGTVYEMTPKGWRKRK